VKKPILLLLAALVLIAFGCGGGGGGTNGGNGSGGGDGTIVGRVLNVETGGPPSPVATVQTTADAVQTSPADGSFAVEANSGTTQLIVDSNTAIGVFTFTVPSVNDTVDAGDLWIGPERVTLTGRVLDSSTSLPVQNATVSFAGRTGTTNASGQFSLQEVAYSSVTQTAFWGIFGSVRATNYFRTDFSASPSLANAGVVTVDDILITPTSDTDPPPLPFNITGRVSPSNQAPGTIVTLRDSGGNPVRVFNVGTSGTYQFWATPGDYTITYQNGTLTAPQQSATVAEADVVVQVPDVTLG
jgi:hypothetical protein